MDKMDRMDGGDVDINRVRLVAIAGPTALGKSEIAVQLAECFGGEILNVDSMQVYRGLYVGTGKPGPELRARIPHHLLDLAEPWEEFNASRFAFVGEPALRDILARGRLPILCGGTGLYFRALLEGFFDAPAPPKEIRETLERQYQTEGLAPLRERLEAVDPEWARRILPQDARRTIRALEVYETTGRKPSDLRKGQETKPWLERTLMLGIQAPWPVIDQRIEERVEWMIRNGLLQEAEWLLGMGGGSRTVRQAIGYKEVFPYLRGEITLDQAKSDLARATKRFARRQMTWFRHQTDAIWLENVDLENMKKKIREFLAFED